MPLQDLFAATSYSHFAAPVPGWQMGPPHGMGFAMQYAMVKLNSKLIKFLSGSLSQNGLYQ